MNQIGELSEFKVITSKYLSVEIPENQWYNDEIYLYAIPRLKNGDKEIILSHVNPAEWNYIWELSLNINKDISGIVYRMTKILMELDINICKTEGVTPNEDIDFSLWFFVNINFFVNKNELHWQDIEKIKIQLKASIEEKLKESDLKDLEIKTLGPNEFLFENFWLIAQNKNINKVSNLTEYFNNPIRFPLIQRKGNIPILKLFSSLDINRSESVVFSTILSDLGQSNYLILRLFNPNQKILYVNFLHKHEVGAINKIAEILFTESNGAYNLLYNRSTVKKDKPDNEDYENACNWYVLIELKDCEAKCNEIFEKIESSNMSVGQGSVRVIKNSKNLDGIIRDRYKYVKPVEKKGLERFKQFYPLLNIVLSICLIIILLFYNSFNYQNLINNTLVIFILNGLLLGLLNISNLKEGVSILKNVLKKNNSIPNKKKN